MKYQPQHNTIFRHMLVLVVLSMCTVFVSCDEKVTLDLVDPVPLEPVALMPGLPADIAGYNQWLKLNAEPIPPVAGSDPHRGTKDVFVNQDRDTIAPGGRQQYPYPDGSIVVKESRADAGFIRLVAIMRKKAGSNPAGNDWEYEEYIRRDADSPFPKPLTGAFCGGCHARAADRDYVFTVLE